MSAKSKGKQRAVDEPVEISSGDTFSLVIRFTTSSTPDLTITAFKEGGITVVHLKQEIRRRIPALEHNKLRLITQGKVLVDADSIQAPSPLQNADDNPGQPSKVWVHCSIGAEIEQGEAEIFNTQGQLRPLRGFNRLASAGFSEADISNFRRQFHGQSATNWLDATDFDTDEEYAEHYHTLEEEWIDNMSSEPSLVLSSMPLSLSNTGHASAHSVLRGVALGFFFPVIPFFFIQIPKPDTFWEDGQEMEGGTSVIFGKEMQFGVFVGFAMNVIFGMWRYLLHSL